MTDTGKILLVEDDLSLCYTLEKNDFIVKISNNIVDAEKIISKINLTLSFWR